MRILDLRPSGVRLMSSLWSQGKTVRGPMTEDPGPGNPAVRLAGRVADHLMARRVRARRKIDGGPYLVSVGNLALGGTGKTPVVISLGSALATEGLKGAVLTRGFGSRLDGPLVVSSDNGLAGDEARLMAAALDGFGWPVIQAKRRQQGLDLILKDYPGLDTVIVEDGHQTAHLGRDLDIVILDSWVMETVGGEPRVKPITGPVMPIGPWRESSAGALRAGIWVLETEDDSLPGGCEGQEVATFQRHLTLLTPDGKAAVNLVGRRPAILSGIARPEAFEASLQHVLSDSPVLGIRCGDHAEYAPRIVARMTSAVESAGGDYLVTTAKDWVKLQPFWPATIPVVVANLEIRWGKSKTLPAMVGERLHS